MSRALEPIDLTEILAYYDTLLDIRRRYLRVPGVQAAVFADGDLAFTGAYGYADLETSTKLTDAHLFRIASHSKTFTATVILQLAEEGRLRLDDEVSTHVGELTGSPVGTRRIRDLLSHTGGLTRDGSEANYWQLFGHFPDEKGLLAVLEQPPILDAVDRLKYSNIGYGLLGLVIARASGTPYNDRVRQTIVDRLGLTDLGPELVPERLSEYAAGYSALAYSDDRVPIEHVDTGALAAATGFYATARDLVRYFAAHLPGDERLLSEDSKRQMQHSEWDTGIDDLGYGLGMMIATVGDREVFGHAGGYPGHSTRTFADPETGVVVSALTNAVDGPAEPLARLLLDLVDLARKETRPSTPLPERFAGRFADLGGVTDIAVVGGRLYGISPTQPDPLDKPTPLEVVDDTTLLVAGGNGFGAYGEKLRYTFGDDGTVKEVRTGNGGTMWPIEDFQLPARVQLTDAAPRAVR